MTQWNERTLLITGGSRGIGSGLVERFLNLGSRVITTATTPSGTDKIIERYEGQKCSAYVLDLSELDSIQEFLRTLKMKGYTIDTLVNNAGVTNDQLSIQISYEQWARVINTNLNGTFLLTQGVLRPMIRSRFGRIVMITSVVSFTGNSGQTSYCASKAGLEGLMKALALEVASRQITVNSIAPGFIETDMTNKLTEEQRRNLQKKIPMNSFGQVQDVVHSCEFLVSAEARYMTGQTLHVNGGVFMS